MCKVLWGYTVLKQVRKLAVRGNAMFLNLRGIIPESFAGKVKIELLELSGGEAVIKIKKAA